MQKKELYAKLDELLTELKTLKSDDETCKQKTSELLILITETLENTDNFSGKHRLHLLKKLTNAAEHFETSHPTVTAVIDNIVNILSNLGI